MGQPARRSRLAAALAAALALVATAPDTAAGASGLPVAGIDPFGWVKDQVLGGLQWGVEQAAGFVTNLLAGIADALIPDWLADEALALVGWAVAVPNYAAGGQGQGGYAFGGVNALRGTLTWVAVTLIPLTLTVAIGRSALGLGSDHPVAPLTRALTAIALVLLYPLVWSQLAVGANRLTGALLRVPAVERGLDKQFEFIVGGGALRGVPLLGALLLLVAAALLIALLVLKLVLLVAGAVLYVTGVLMPGIAATERGQAIGQAWVTATVGLMAIPVIWTIVFAVGALLMGDAGSAAAEVAGSGKLKQLVGGLMLAVGSIAATAVALKIGTAVAGIVIGQVGGALALAGGGGPRRGVRSVAGAASSKLSAFGDRLGGALRQTAGDQLPGRARSGALAALAGGGTLLRGGLIGAAGAGGRRALASSAGVARRAASHAPAGAVAARLGQSARAGWASPGAAPRWRQPPGSGPPPGSPGTPPAAGHAAGDSAPAGTGTPPTGSASPGSQARAAAPPSSTEPSPRRPADAPAGDSAPGRPASRRPPYSPDTQGDRPRRRDEGGGSDADVPPTR